MANEISPSLPLAFSASLHQGIVPQDWKQALVTPLYKKGNRSNPANYRPISLTCICSKILEHIVHTNIMSHLINLNILSDSQFGFRKNYSAELQLIKTTHDIALNLNAKSQTDVILLDFSKAFDKVSHQLLLSKLQYYGIAGQLLGWISSFLSGHTQRVVCGGQSSDPVNVASGVPQGSVLGPLLFLLFINDITHHLSSTCRLYADDCILYRCIDSQSDIDALQEDLKQLEIWEEIWNMKFNIDKCMVLHVTLKRNPILSEYSLHGHNLNTVSKAKYLGVLLDSRLSFNQHINSTCQKANFVLSFLRRNLKRCHKKVKIDSYNLFVKPILNYAATVWSPYTQCYKNKLESIQRRAARFVMSDYHRTSSVSAMINSLNWQSISRQHEELCLIMFFKIVNKLVELPMPEYIISAPRLTRGNNMKFVQPSINVNPYKYSFFPRSISIWNKLPTCDCSLSHFKYILKSMTLNN